MMRAALLGAGLLFAGLVQAAPIAVYQTSPTATWSNFSLVVDTTSLSSRISIAGETQFDGPVSVGQAVVVSLTAGTAFDQLAALYTNGVDDPSFERFSISAGFLASIDGGPPGPLGSALDIGIEFPDLPDLAGWQIDEFRVTHTVTCWDTDNSPKKDSCSTTVDFPFVAVYRDVTVEILGHLADASVPEPGSAALVAAALLGLAGVRRRVPSRA